MTHGDVLDRFQGVTALVIGDLMLDEYVYGSAMRISPEAPVMVIRHKATTHVPGGAANVARNVEALGAKAILVGAVGADATGALLRDALIATSGAQLALVEDASRQTTRKTRVFADRSHQALRIDAEDDAPISEAVEDRLLEEIESKLASAQVVAFSDYLKGCLTRRLIETVIGLAQSHNVPIVANPKPQSAALYSGASLLSLNRSEAERSLGVASLADEDAPAAAETLREKFGVERLLITLGDRGMVAALPEPVRVSARAVEVSDVAGAGDTVLATIALGAASVGLRPEVFELAAETAAAVVRHAGVAAPTPEDLRAIRGG